jgi:hypothetical protein
MSKPLSSVLGSIATYVYGRYIDEVLQMQRCGTGILPVDCTTGVPPVDYYYHTDDLYNVMAVTDGAGNVVERYEYDDYGTPMVMAPDGTVFASSTIGNPYLFTGRRYDAETSWYHPLPRPRRRPLHHPRHHRHLGRPVGIGEWLYVCRE